MDGKTYPISFTDDEMFMMLEDVNWAYLKEIFSEVHPWKEKVRYGARATWIEIYGIPLHCWNHGTIKKRVRGLHIAVGKCYKGIVFSGRCIARGWIKRNS
ncbi:hypothetical protein V6N13_060833 [Hibiscus sabdariffa]